MKQLALLPTDKIARKERPVARGVLDYFPQAIAEVARVSFIGNQQHNPGEPMHWDRSKSTDHADCIIRHVIERGTIDDDGLRHSAKAAWRALALLQEELDAAQATGPYHLEWFAERQECPSIEYLAKQAVRTPEMLMADLGFNLEVARHVAAGTSFTTAEIGWVYIAGPMRGYEKFNFPVFDVVRDRYLHAGWNVISPADIDRNAGCTEDTPPNQVVDPRPFTYRDFLALYWIAHQKNGAIAMLPGWEKSTGATAEFFLARWLGLKVLDHDKQLLVHMDIPAIAASVMKFLDAQLPA